MYWYLYWYLSLMYWYWYWYWYWYLLVEYLTQVCSEYITVAVQWVLFVVGTVGNITVLVVLVWRRSRSQVKKS